ncbi:MAG: acyl transferase domain-containing protein, partial [Kiritimatiellia bacterium]
MTAIAIVGMGCRIAGGENLQSYWKLMIEGRNAFGPIPADRWPADLFFDKNRRATDKSYAPHGAFLKDIRGFPAIALGLPPRRVEVMDPQQRLALEVALQATEDAGYRPSELPRRTGVYVGVTATEYRSLSAIRIAAVLMASGHLGQAPQDPTAIAAAVENMAPSRPYAAPGGLGNMCAAIVAQELDLHGPAYTTDAACASAHMAIYDAVQQLRTGAIDAALAGGTYAQILPDHYVVFSRIGAMSAKGYCRPFDSRADGFVQGDGAGIVLLKRLEDAERDGDRIYAVIKGVAINNDGRGDGPMSPDSKGQAEVIRDALRDAKLSADQIQYIEAHGTGTPVGDPAEIASLKLVFGDRDLPVGSAKANVGHLMSAAGIAGLLRATLAVHHKTIPPMAGFGEPSEKLGLNQGGLRIPRQPEPWTDPERSAGCSAFGFGGTNGHIIISAYDGPTPPVMTGAQPAQLLLMSAHSEDSLRALAAETAQALRADNNATLAGACRAWSHRRQQAWRLAIVADDLDHLIENLQLVGEGSSAKGVRLGHATSEPKIAFMYPGQGAQRVGMLRDSTQRFPVLAQALDALEEALGDDLSAPLTHLLYPEKRDNTVSDDVASA